ADRPGIGVQLEAPGEAGLALFTHFTAAHVEHGARLAADHATGIAFSQEHANDALAAFVAEKLPLVLLVPGDAVSFDQGNEVLRGVAGQCRAAEVRALADEVAGADIAVGEI